MGILPASFLLDSVCQLEYNSISSNIVLDYYENVNFVLYIRTYL